MSKQNRFKYAPWFPVGIVITLLLLIPILYPLGLPLSISIWTEGAYKTLSSLPTGSIVVLEDNRPIDFIADVEIGAICMIRVLWAHGARIIAFDIDPSAPQCDITYFNKALVTPQGAGKKYGVDYVILGYAAGWETAIAAFAENIRGVFSTDYYGTPIDNIPMMTNVRSAKDINLVIGQSSTPGETIDVRQWFTKWNVPLIEHAAPGEMIASIPYYGPNGPIEGILDGSRGGSELEKLSGFYGLGVMNADAKSLGFTAAAAMVVLVNIIFYWQKYKGKKGEKNVS